MLASGESAAFYRFVVRFVGGAGIAVDSAPSGGALFTSAWKARACAA